MKKLRISALCLLLAGSLSAAQNRPGTPREEKTRLFVTGGAALLGPSLGAKLRTADSQREVGLRVAVMPGYRTLDGRINLLAENPEPEKRGTFYAGPEVMYAEERDGYGVWKQVWGNVVLGREHQLSPKLQFAWEGGLGWLLSSDRDAMIPIGGIARAEFLFEVL